MRFFVLLVAAFTCTGLLASDVTIPTFGVNTGGIISAAISKFGQYAGLILGGFFAMHVVKKVMADAGSIDGPARYERQETFHDVDGTLWRKRKGRKTRDRWNGNAWKTERSRGRW